MYGVGGAVVHIRRIYNSIIVTANTIHSSVESFFENKNNECKSYIEICLYKTFSPIVCSFDFSSKDMNEYQFKIKFRYSEIA